MADPVLHGLLVIGEAPGADEDREGKGFVGRSGKLLQNLLGQHGFVRGRDYGCANVVRCRPAGNRPPSAAETWDCLPYLAQTIATSCPCVILCVGRSASTIFLGSGTLLSHILDADGRQKAGYPDLHPQLLPVSAVITQIPVIPMPHTSPLAWNRVSPDGRGWAEIGRAQVNRAVTLAGVLSTR
ncbi:uracil-DNA glycosylase [Acidithiobacillus montserratensis]|uniref:Uracil-DNA glycosylase n=1 Tax=Acidithiobacillus montserratensis TaxID=2729135 RepID=A0ACD5HIJ9_9PROT|nr:uracil-DNA glycosylase [Acidithiobacillus montserratensis]